MNPSFLFVLSLFVLSFAYLIICYALSSLDYIRSPSTPPLSIIHVLCAHLPLVAIRRRIRLTTNNRIAFSRILLIGPLEIGLRRRLILWHPRFRHGDHVIAYIPARQVFRFVAVFQYLPRTQLYDVRHSRFGALLVPASFVYPVPQGMEWTQKTGDLAW